jgi:hypothetical protein
MGPRAGLDDVEKRKFLTLSRLELRPLGRPAVAIPTTLSGFLAFINILFYSWTLIYRRFRQNIFNESDLTHAELCQSDRSSCRIVVLKPHNDILGGSWVIAPFSVPYMFFFSLCGRSQLLLVQVTSVLPLIRGGTHVRRRDSVQEMKYKSLLNDPDSGISHTGRHYLWSLSVVSILNRTQRVSGAGSVSIF